MPTDRLKFFNTEGFLLQSMTEPKEHCVENTDGMERGWLKRVMEAAAKEYEALPEWEKKMIRSDPRWPKSMFPED